MFKIYQLQKYKIVIVYLVVM